MNMIKLSIETDSPTALHTIGNAMIQLANVAAIKPVTVHEDEDEEPTKHIGLTWDSRIHSTGKTKNKDGSWKLLKKPKQYADDADGWKTYVAGVVAELTETSTVITGDGTGETLPVIDESDITAYNAGFGTAVTTTEVPAPAPAPAPTPAPTPVPVPVEKGFNDMMKLITSNADVVHIDQVNEICKKFGQEGLSAINTPECTALVPVIYDEIQALITKLKIG